MQNRWKLLSAVVFVVLGLAALVWFLTRPVYLPGEHDHVLLSHVQATVPASEPLRSLEVPETQGAAATPTPAALNGTVYAHFGWGSGQSALARDRPEEANPEAPMSLIATDDGAVVLDQLNGRVVRLDKNGKFVREDKLHVQAAQEIALGPHGELLAMDRLISKEVEILDKAGHSLGKLPLEGKGIENGGSTTGLFVSGDKVYAETSHSVLIELGDVGGKASAERTQLSGRPSRDGSMLLSAGRKDGDGTRLWINALSTAKKQMKWARDVGMGAPIRQILLLESDMRGVVYTAMELAHDDQHVVTQLMCLAPDDGRVLGRVTLPTNILPEETFRDLSVRDDGTVLYVHRTEDGSQYLQYHCP